MANYHLAYSYSAYSRASRFRNAISQHLKVIAEKKYDEQECVSRETGKYQNGYLPRNEKLRPPYRWQKKKTPFQHSVMTVILSFILKMISTSCRYLLAIKMTVWQKQTFKRLSIPLIVLLELSLTFNYLYARNYDGKYILIDIFKIIV